MEASRNFSFDIQPCSDLRMAINHIVFDSCWFQLPRSEGSSGGYDYDPAFVSSNANFDLTPHPTKWMSFGGGCESGGEYSCVASIGGICCATASSGNCLQCGNNCIPCQDPSYTCGSAGTTGSFYCGTSEDPVSCVHNCPPTRPNTCFTGTNCCGENICQTELACCDDGNWQQPIDPATGEEIYPLAFKQCGFGIAWGLYASDCTYVPLCSRIPCNKQFTITPTAIAMTGRAGNHNPRLTRTNGSVQPITETLQTVATFSRTQLAENVDFVKQLNLTVTDTLTPTQYATPQFPDAYPPLTKEEMNIANGFCSDVPTIYISNCTAPTPCKGESSECSICGVATATLIIKERGPTQPAFVPNGAVFGKSNLIVGQQYEIVTVGNMKWKCYGWLPKTGFNCSNSGPAIGDIFVAADCSNVGGCATQAYCNCASSGTFPVYTGTCLPVRTHTFQVKGRGHTQSLLQRFIDNFDSELWHYFYDTTDTTYRGTKITGYSSTKPYADDYIGGSLINSDCCSNSWQSQYIPKWEKQQCKGCVNGLYYHEKEIVDLKNLNFKSIPDVYVQLFSTYCERHYCFTETFSEGPTGWYVNPCESAEPYQVFPARTWSACYDLRHEQGGGSRGGGVQYVTDYKAVKRNTDALSYAADWGINSSQGLAFNCTCNNIYAPCNGVSTYNIYFLSE